ncbi:MAG TPA: histidine phosphatase family protein, partial [Gemmataceae bacterium]|nr:histidine phosphatase family protein [Gemmataceae bacterium]
MRTLLYLLRHAATEANLVRPARLQGRRHNPPLAPLGVRQAELTRDFLAIRAIDRCYSSPLLRAMQTASMIAAPHGLLPEPLEALTECDVGDWEGLAWETIRAREPEQYERFMSNPAAFGYPNGESFADVHQRAAKALDELLSIHEGQSVLVVAHHIINRTYLAGLLGLTPDRARQVTLDNCGISVAVREGERTTVTTLNATFHLQGLAA